jgi:hypothetical protein
VRYDRSMKDAWKRGYYKVRLRASEMPRFDDDAWTIGQTQDIVR